MVILHAFSRVAGSQGGCPIATAAAAYRRSHVIADRVIHLLGLAAVAAGIAALAVLAVRRADPLLAAGLAVYSIGLAASFGCSALYNVRMHSPRRELYRRLDHAAIYLLIAGTYTPFLIGGLGGARGWSVLAFVWTLALGGVAKKLLFPRRFERLSIALYLVLGWSILAAGDALYAALPPATLVLVVAGGLVYSGGVVFYAWAHLPYHKAIWHACVLAAAACHFAAILVGVVLRA